LQQCCLGGNANPGLVLENPSIDEAPTAAVLIGMDASLVVDPSDGRRGPQTCAIVLSVIICSGFPPEFSTVVRYPPWSCRCRHALRRNRPHEILALVIGVETDFLNHALRGCPAESGLICDDGENP
jgi:hypothetical protein